MYNESSKNATIKYQRERMHSIPLRLLNEKYDELKSAAEAAGESVNGYIKKAIAMRMEKERGE